MAKQRGGPDTIPWSETAACEGRRDTRPSLLISLLVLFLAMLFLTKPAGFFKSPGRHILDFSPAIGTTAREATMPGWPPVGEQSLHWRTMAAQLPSASMFVVHVHPAWVSNDAPNNLVWLVGFGALLALLITYLLRLQAKRRATEQIAARGREFQEILAGMAADLIATPDCLGTGEMKSWLKPFLR